MYYSEVALTDLKPCFSLKSYKILLEWHFLLVFFKIKKISFIFELITQNKSKKYVLDIKIMNDYKNLLY